MPSEKSKSGAGVTAPSSSSITLDIVKHLQGAKNNAVVERMTDAGSVVTVPRFLSTGLPIIDAMLGGGIPAGRITELFSKGEGMGKSSLAAVMMAEMQRQGGSVLLMDTEHGFTEDRLRLFGVDPTNVIFVQPSHIEDGCLVISETLKYLKNNPEYGDKLLIVWDSMTATPSKAEFDADYGDIQVASSARAWSVNIKKLKDEIARSECYVILINQTRTNIGQMFGEKTTTTGGLAVKYYSGNRLVMFRGQGAWLKEGTERVGFKTTMMTEKSRVSSPYQQAVAHYYFEKGYDKEKALFDLLLKIGVITQNGGYYTMEGVAKSFQQSKFSAALDELNGSNSKGSKAKVVQALKAAHLIDSAIEVFFPA